MVNILKDFRVIVIAREKSMIVPFNATPTRRSTQLANVAIETPPVITVDVMKLVSTMFAIVLNHFIFFAGHSRT